MVLITAALALSLSTPAVPDATDIPSIADLQQQAPQTDAQAQPAPQSGDPHDQQSPDPKEQKADAQKPPTPEHTGIHALFGNLVEDIKLLPRMQNVYIAAAGGGLALAVHPADQSVNAHLMSHYDLVNTIYAPGKYVGDTPEQVAFSLSTYALGRIFDQPKVSHLGMDLVQAQLLTELMVEPLKFAVGRRRPDGSNNQSFPSGHSAVTFATATVIERHLGWRKSLLAYVIASYVASSRLHDNVHYLSDVVFGAAVGTIAGRTVVHHPSDYWAVMPVSVPGGGVALMVTRTK